MRGFVRIWTREDGQRVAWVFVPDGTGGVRPYGEVDLPEGLADGDYPLQEPPA